MIIRKTVSFEAAHALPYFESVHGHSYEVRVEITGPANSSGVVRNFQSIENIVKDTYDHICLNDFMENPTMENIALDIKNRLGASKVILSRPTLKEEVEV